jgi:hypothetical protein
MPLLVEGKARRAVTLSMTTGPCRGTGFDGKAPSQYAPSIAGYSDNRLARVPTRARTSGKRSSEFRTGRLVQASCSQL